MKDQSQVLEEIRQAKWERWAERPFQAFTLSFFEDASRRENFAQIGIFNTELKAQLFQLGSWYYNAQALKEASEEIGGYLEQHTVFDITAELDRFRTVNKAKIAELVLSSQPIEERFFEIYKILKTVCTFVWTAHILEFYYKARLMAEVPKYIKEDIEKFIGDASFPKKKNAHAYLEEMMRAGVPAEEIVAKLGWLKIRDGFSDPFSIEEIEKMRAELKPSQPHSQVEIPAPLQDLFKQVQEIVFFRTARTDVFYELYYLARPILKELALKYDLTFEELRYYRAKSFLSGKPERYSPNCTFAYWQGEVIFQDEPILEVVQIAKGAPIKGAIAYKGVVRGVVKIVKNVAELHKVKTGDILVTQMTFPSFLPAMIRATAFVTDEGGITCHAAIVAREMRKPCIIGTKIATQVLQDGMEVEVDADSGVVKIML